MLFFIVLVHFFPGDYAKNSLLQCKNPAGRKVGSIGLGTGFWFFHEILSFDVADFEYNPQNREYLIGFFNISILFHAMSSSRQLISLVTSRISERQIPNA